MKKIVLLSALLAISSALTAQEVQGPDGALKVNVELKDGNPIYSVHYNNKIFLEPSPLGLKTSIGDFSARLKQLGHQVRTIDETYTMPHAKVSRVHYQANELVCNYLNEKGDTLQVIFRVSNNDIAQAYRISSPKHTHCIIEKETTGFDFPSYTTTFITPQAPAGDGWMGTKPSYEEEYTLDEAIGTPSRYKLGYTFPALFHVGNDGWVLVSETGVSSLYAGTKLSEGTQDGLYTIAFPEKAENGGVGDATIAASIPSLTSWKTITVGETLKPIVETTSAYDNVRPFYEPTQVYQPGRSTWSWILWQDASCNYKDQQTFIDLAAAMGYEYILIDALWDKQIGYENMPSLIAYAQSKGVDVLLWYNSNGSCNDAPQGPKHRLDSAPARQKEMAWMKALGVKGIKVDFFGGDKQATMKLYEDILTDANQYGIAVVFHGCTLPRGWERMYPNHMSSEAALVSENLVFGQYHADKEAQRSTLYPFIRNAVSAMDFGGVFFNKHFSKDGVNGTLRKTTDAFQIATSVLYQSGIQHFGITPNNLTEQPEFILDFMKKVPTVWDETRFIDGYPGKYCVVARRYGNQWYIAATNATEQSIKLNLSLPWLMNQQVSIIHDNEARTASLSQGAVNKKGILTIEIQPMGGAMIYTK
nr:glycoside hydrolase family 97 protein [Bacteroides intestinalis]